MYGYSEWGMYLCTPSLWGNCLQDVIFIVFNNEHIKF